MSPSGGTPNLPDRLLPHAVPVDSTFVRIHRIGHDARWFGPAPGDRPLYRFDAPSGEYRTLYGAMELEGAFAETVLRRPRQLIQRDFVEARQWSEIRVMRDLTLAKLYDNGLAWHGVTADICTGDTYAPSQALGAALHAKFPDLDGIAYRSRHNNGEICYAIFDRVVEAHLQIVDVRQFVNERSRADGLMRLHNASWDPGTPLPPV